MQNVGVFIIQLVCVGEIKKKNGFVQKTQSRKAIANSMNIQQTIVKGTKKYSLAKALKTFRISTKKRNTNQRQTAAHIHTRTQSHTRSWPSLICFRDETKESKCQMANSLGWTDIEKRSESIKSNQFRTCTRKTNKHTSTHTGTHTLRQFESISSAAKSSKLAKQSKAREI